MSKTAVESTKPVYLGMCILDISKFYMYDFHYRFAKTHSVEPKLLYMDTDSFIYWVKNCDPYTVMKRESNEFDTSGYAADNPYGIVPQNKKVIGLMKDEANGLPIVEFVGLRSKTYAYRTMDSGTQRWAKVVRRSASRYLTIEDYLRCLYGGSTPPHMLQQTIIQSRGREVFIVRLSKVGLSSHDDKRVICEDGAETLPYSHYLLDVREGVGDPDGVD